MSHLKAIHVVYANWCPHCVPTTVDAMKEAVQTLNVPLVLYDIDTDMVKRADELVRKYGDWAEDYLIPQVFLELEGGEFKHVLTGYSEGVPYTKRAIGNLLRSELLRSVTEVTAPRAG